MNSVVGFFCVHMVRYNRMQYDAESIQQWDMTHSK